MWLLNRYLALSFLLIVLYINYASWMYLAALLENKALGAKNSGELTSVTMPAGFIGGTETIIFYCLFMLLPQYLTVLFSIMGILVVITIMQRLIWATRNL